MVRMAGMGSSHFACPLILARILLNYMPVLLKIISKAFSVIRSGKSHCKI